MIEFYERASGARMHAAYIRPGGIAFDLTEKTISDMGEFIKQFPARLREMDSLLRTIVYLKKEFVT